MTDDALEAINDRIDEIESDNRYPSGEDEEFEDVAVNAPLALMQCEWRGELIGLKRARKHIKNSEA